MDEPSLSERELRILEEIERNLAADDPDFARKVRSPGSRNPSQALRLGIFGMFVGFLCLVGGYTIHTGLGVLGFLVMLAGAYGVGMAVRSGGPAKGEGEGSVFRSALKRAEGRMRFRRKDR